MKIVKTLSVTLAAISSVSLAMAEPRTWTAADGRTVVAEFGGLNGNRVILKIEGRGNVPFPLTGLSEADRQWVAEEVKKMAKAEPKLPSTSSSTTAETGKAGTAKDFLGTWEGFMANTDGSPQGRMNLVITADSITATNGQGQPMGGGTYKLRGEEGVLRIDNEGTSGQYEGKKYEGIVTIEGNTMKWCSTNDRPGLRRPSEMKTDLQQGHFLMIMEKK